MRYIALRILSPKREQRSNGSSKAHVLAANDQINSNQQSDHIPLSQKSINLNEGSKERPGSNKRVMPSKKQQLKSSSKES